MADDQGPTHANPPHDATVAPGRAHRPPEPPPATPINKKAEKGSVKETVEQILVAFILAFIFRAFVVEAFVIPTGSMAPTLLGAHMHFTGPQTGYDFTVNYSAPSNGVDLTIPPYAVAGGVPQVFPVRDPITGRLFPREDEANPANDATAAPVNYGDRILVLKYVYLLNEPARWDVVVFKNPNGIQVGSDRFLKDYSQNYIKRLIGKPGEAVLLLDGDVFIAPGEKYKDPAAYTVQTKPHDAQQALWRIVYDNDYLPPPDRREAVRYVGHDDPAFQQPWTPVDGSDAWDLESRNFGRTFVFNGQQSRGVLRFDADANSGKHALTDWLAYNITLGSDSVADSYRSGGYQDPQLNNVSDIKLELVYHRTEGDGPLTLSSTKRDHLFQAVFGPGDVRLLMTRPGEQTPVEIGRVERGVGDSPQRVALTIADWQASVAVDNETIITTTADTFAPDVATLIEEAPNTGRKQPKPEVRITAENQTAALSHVQLWRDIYYTDRSANGGFMLHAVADNFPNKVMVLEEDEFFTLGDNSIISLDARAWTNAVNLPQDNLFVQPGRVPRQFILGKAFFVYWPAGYRPYGNLPALVPNFGDMRFIK